MNERDSWGKTREGDRRRREALEDTVSILVICYFPDNSLQTSPPLMKKFSFFSGQLLSILVSWEYQTGNKCETYRTATVPMVDPAPVADGRLPWFTWLVIWGAGQQSVPQHTSRPALQPQVTIFGRSPLGYWICKKSSITCIFPVAEPFLNR